MLAKILFAFACVLGLASSVEVLTDANFESSISNGDAWFVKFYAPWCGHCKQLAPTWDKLPAELESQGIKTHVAKVDCTTSRDVCSQAGVRGYPTLKLYKAGSPEPVAYSGARSIPAFVSFLQSNQ